MIDIVGLLTSQSAGIIKNALGLVFTGGLVYLITKITEYTSQISAMKDCVLWIQRNKLMEMCKEYIEAGEVSIEELQSLEEAYKSYHKLRDTDKRMARLYQKVLTLKVLDDIYAA